MIPVAAKSGEETDERLQEERARLQNQSGEKKSLGRGEMNVS